MIFGFHNSGELFGYLSDYQLLKKDILGESSPRRKTCTRTAQKIGNTGYERDLNLRLIERSYKEPLPLPFPLVTGAFEA
jgi:hypothetical protein